MTKFISFFKSTEKLKLKLVDVDVKQKNEPIFILKDMLHVSTSRFTIDEILDENIIKNMDSKSSFYVGRIINNFYRDKLKFDKVAIKNDGTVSLCSTYDPKYKYKTHILKVLDNEDILSECTPKTLKSLASKYADYQIKNTIKNTLQSIEQLEKQASAIDKNKKIKSDNVINLF